MFLDGYVYRSNAGRPSIVDCLDPRSAKVVWQGPSGGSSWSSVVYAAGHLYLTDQTGSTLVFEPTPEEFVAVANNRLNEPTNSTMAISNGDIFVRTFKHLYCIAEE